jgi:hypothetical protein
VPNASVVLAGMLNLSWQAPGARTARNSSAITLASLLGYARPYHSVG